MSRLSPLPPDDLTGDRRALHDDISAAVDEYLKGPVAARPDGALVGPFAPMLNFPAWGGPAWAYTKSVMEHSTLPKPVREIVILVTGAANRTRYELYAHERIAAGTGLSEQKIATVVAGQRPADLTAEEAVAYDAAAALNRGGPLPETTYHRAVGTFGEEGTAELVYLIGAYAMVSVLLNAFDVDVPGADETVT